MPIYKVALDARVITHWTKVVYVEADDENAANELAEKEYTPPPESDPSTDGGWEGWEQGTPYFDHPLCEIEAELVLESPPGTLSNSAKLI